MCARWRAGLWRRWRRVERCEGCGLVVEVRVVVCPGFGRVLFDFGGSAVGLDPAVVAEGFDAPRDFGVGRAAGDSEGAGGDGVGGRGVGALLEGVVADFFGDVEEGHGSADGGEEVAGVLDRKSTRLNS